MVAAVTGEYLFIVIPLALLWVLVTSIVLVRSASAAIERPAVPGAAME